MENRKKAMLLYAILSLSMANSLVGTGISPALETIRNSFSDAHELLIQMIVSLPSLMVIVVSFFFAAMSRKISLRGLCLLGLGLFTVGGLLGGLCNSIYTMVVTRVIIGTGYGIMMPLSIGMLPYFYESSEQQKLNGKVVISSSISSILCMIAAGYLASISWRSVFLVYLFGIPCLYLCLKYIPAETLPSESSHVSLEAIRKTWVFAIGIFIIFISYFAILNNFSGIVINEQIVSEKYVGLIMPIMTVASLITGQYADWFKNHFKKNTLLLIWIFAIGGLMCLLVKSSLIFSIAGLILFGTALALAASTLNAEAGMRCGKEEALCAGTIMMFCRSFGQFISPVLFTAAGSVLSTSDRRLPYFGSALLCAIMFILYFNVVKGRQRKSL